MSAARIQASAWLYGIEGVNPGAARILDIGCGEASHLLPFALAYPQAEIVGIDLSAEKIEAGQLQFKLAGIKNTQLLCVDLESLIAGFGVKFDYIIIHGLSLFWITRPAKHYSVFAGSIFQNKVLWPCNGVPSLARA
jgi:cyclopropane fatty-acyl-phospholipid synthase-like methyltransferase